MNKRFITFAVAVFLGLASADEQAITPQKKFEDASKALEKPWDSQTT